MKHEKILEKLFYATSDVLSVLSISYFRSSLIATTKFDWETYYQVNQSSSHYHKYEWYSWIILRLKSRIMVWINSENLEKVSMDTWTSDPNQEHATYW